MTCEFFTLTKFCPILFLLFLLKLWLYFYWNFSRLMYLSCTLSFLLLNRFYIILPAPWFCLLSQLTAWSNLLFYIIIWALNFRYYFFKRSRIYSYTFWHYIEGTDNIFHVWNLLLNIISMVILISDNLKYMSYKDFLLTFNWVLNHILL